MLRLSLNSRRWRLFACIRELQNACGMKLCGSRGFEVSLGLLNGWSFRTSARNLQVLDASPIASFFRVFKSL